MVTTEATTDLTAVRNRVVESINRQPLAALATAAEISHQGRRRQRRQRGLLSLAAAAIVAVGIGVVGSVVGDRDPVQELATNQAIADSAPAPATLEWVNDGLIGVATMPGDGGPEWLQLVESADGEQWREVPGGAWTPWPDYQLPDGTWARIGAIDMALHDGIMHVVWARPKPLPAGEATEERVSAELSLAWGRFDPEQATWVTTVHDGVVEVDHALPAVSGLELAVADPGALVSLVVFPDRVGELFQDDLSHDEVCGLRSIGARIEFRRCGSDTVEERDTSLRVTTLVGHSLFAAPSDWPADAAGREVGQDDQTAAIDRWSESQFVALRRPVAPPGGSLTVPVYAFDDETGLGIGPSGQAIRLAEVVGETRDGETWSPVFGPVTSSQAIVARGDERVVLSGTTMNPVSTTAPLRGLWFSGSSALDELRTHRIRAGQDIPEIAATYGVSALDLAEANAELGLGPPWDQPLDVGSELVIPDPDPTARNWQSIDLRDVVGDRAPSQLHFLDLKAGPAGYVVTVIDAAAGFRPGPLDETTTFVVESDEGRFEGLTPFGPATLYDAAGNAIEQWFHFEARQPDWTPQPGPNQPGPDQQRAAQSRIEPSGATAQVVIVTDDGTEVRFDAGEWFDATVKRPAQQMFLLFSSNGVDWQLLDEVVLDGGPLLGVGDTHAYLISWDGIQGIDRVALPVASS